MSSTNSSSSSNNNKKRSSSENLFKIAQNLRLYKSDHTSHVSIKSHGATKSSTAAVLIGLFEAENGDLHVILTQRSSTMSSHSGEVALPGGRWEEGDADFTETALREAKEEIGLDPSFVEVVTILEPFQTKNDITVFPVVGIIWDKNGLNLVPNAAEVESIFDAPLEMFLKNENRREEEREWMGYRHLLHYFDYQTGSNKSYVIWALTAGILIKTASVVYQRPPAFQEHRPRFWSRQ